MTDPKEEKAQTNAPAEESEERPILEDQIGRFPGRLAQVVGRSVRAFAKECGVAEGTLRRYLSGDRLPTLDRLYKIANAAGVSPAWLATGEGEMDWLAVIGPGGIHPAVVQHYIEKIERDMPSGVDPALKAKFIVEVCLQDPWSEVIISGQAKPPN